MEEYIRNHKLWLRQEQEIEAQETEKLLETMSKQQLQKAGLAILGLYPGDIKTCLGGKLSVGFSLDPNNLQQNLPKSQIKSGDVVSVESAGSADKLTGTVHRVTKDVITVIMDTDPDLSGPVRLVKMCNSVSFIRMEKALSSLKEDHPIMAAMFGAGDMSATDDIDYKTDAALNEEQNAAVKMALQARHLALIHGPPGTGKTQCICSLLGKLRNKKVLLTASSNLAVDNVVERCPALNIVRIGHPARLTEEVLSRSLDHALYSSDSAGIIGDIRRDIEKQLHKLKTSRQRKDIYRELKMLRAELRDREARQTDEVFRNTKIVACTLNGSGSKTVRQQGPFDVIIVDEASQALQAETWIAASQGPKLILVGDHHQLPPTAHIESLRTTLFDLLVAKQPGIMLQRQYRMHQDIMGWSNSRFYGKLLTADCSVKDATVAADLDPVVFMDTHGQGMWERGDVGESLWNEHEASIVLSHLTTLIQNYPQITSFAIISPYSAQVEHISQLCSRESLPSSLQIGTIDGFQGREADVVIISLVRSNPEKRVGFLKEARRLNVALTRARRHLCVVGDSETLRSEYGDLVEYFNSVALVVVP